jgi:hypothetical protein
MGLFLVAIYLGALLDAIRLVAKVRLLDFICYIGNLPPALRLAMLDRTIALCRPQDLREREKEMEREGWGGERQ